MLKDTSVDKNAVSAEEEVDGGENNLISAVYVEDFIAHYRLTNIAKKTKMTKKQKERVDHFKEILKENLYIE